MDLRSDTASSQVHVVVTMTCHNRRDLSCRIVQALQSQATHDVRLEFVAVDDGSSDGTGDALRNLGVAVLQGDGSLYWAGGMRMAHSFAVDLNPDILLWVNDDLELMPDAVDSLLRSHMDTGGRSILVGNVASASNGAVAYGGRNQNPRNPLSFELAEGKHPTFVVDTFNGNFVGIPRSVYGEIKFPKGYRHAYADLAFGISAGQTGYISQMIPRVVGTNDRNPQTGRMFSADISLFDRVIFALSPFGLPPLQQWRFALLVSGWKAPYWFLRSYSRVFFPTWKSVRRE